MTAQLAESCAAIAYPLALAASLIAEPDTQPGPGTRTAPGSKPPWNAENANLVFEVIVGLGDIEAEFRHTITGTINGRPAYRQTGHILKSIAAMAAAVSDDYAAEARRQLEAWVTRIEQLPAIDLQEKPRKVRSACPFCEFGMLRLMPRSGKVTCLRYGACFVVVSGAMVHPVGELAVSAVDGEPRIFWNDGSVT